MSRIKYFMGDKCLNFSMCLLFKIWLILATRFINLSLVEGTYV